MDKYIFIQTYGCSANQNNSEILKGILRQAGYEITSNEKIADILIINTCVVKKKTEDKIKRKIQDINKQYPDKICIISGCMPETNSEQIKKLNPKAILLGTHHFRDILRLIQKHRELKLDYKKEKEFLDYICEEKINLPKIPKNKLISIIQISEGCSGKCSFCKTRLAKGKLFSYSKNKISKSIENDLNHGAKEIWITSQDNAVYNLDKGEGKLPELLQDILKIKHNFKLRLGMMNPNNLLLILNEIIKLYENEKMYKFLHLPIQSASNKILENMNRFYKIEKVEKIIKAFRKKFPDITIATDIIVGYPTEKMQDHQKNINFIKEFKPDVLNISKFSSHKETEAGMLKPLPISIVKERTSELMEMHRKTALENKKKFLNEIKSVFVNRKIEDNLYESRDKNYNIIIVNSKENVLGKNVKVMIKGLGVHHMIGDLVG